MLKSIVVLKNLVTTTHHLRPISLITKFQAASFSSPKDKDDYDVSRYAGRSNLFGADPYMKEVKKRIGKEYHEDDRYEAD